MSDALGLLQDQTFARATPATAISFPANRRMTSSQLCGYLDRHVFAVVGTTRPEGRPHSAMSSYFRLDATFWLPTVAGSVRERNVRGEPWMTLVVTEGDRGDHLLVIVEGPAGIVEPADVPADVRAAIGGDWVSTWLRLQTERLLSYASPGTTPPPGSAANSLPVGDGLDLD